MLSHNSTRCQQRKRLWVHRKSYDTDNSPMSFVIKREVNLGERFHFPKLDEREQDFHESLKWIKHALCGADVHYRADKTACSTVRKDDFPRRSSAGFFSKFSLWPEYLWYLILSSFFTVRLLANFSRDYFSYFWFVPRRPLLLWSLPSSGSLS